MLNAQIVNITRRATYTSIRTIFTFKNTITFNSMTCNTFANYLHLQHNHQFLSVKRFKSKESFSKQSIQNKHKEEEEEEDEDELGVDDYLNTDKSKIITANVPSLRLDAVAKIGFGISRAKLDREFYNSHLRINGKKCLKKSTMVQIGDEIDHIQGPSSDNPNFLIVNRFVLLASEVDPESEKITVKLVQNKSLLVEDYTDHRNSDK